MPRLKRNTEGHALATYSKVSLGHEQFSLIEASRRRNGRADNAIKYAGKSGGLTATGNCGRDDNSGLGGEVPGHFKVSTKFGGGLAYANGPFSVGAAYDQFQGSTLASADLTAKRAALGASYAFGAAKAFAGYRWMRDEVTTGIARHDNLY